MFSKTGIKALLHCRKNPQLNPKNPHQPDIQNMTNMAEQDARTNIAIQKLKTNNHLYYVAAIWVGITALIYSTAALLFATKLQHAIFHPLLLKQTTVANIYIEATIIVVAATLTLYLSYRLRDKASKATKIVAVIVGGILPPLSILNFWSLYHQTQTSDVNSNPVLAFALFTIILAAGLLFALVNSFIAVKLNDNSLKHIQQKFDKK